ncbi:MAG: UDP-N-acetylmuramoyl-L-alanyl-D-glutamate--2,6-diaminopimelate ligase [Clostridiales bacterium]|jgi:UDP-N-acetylmuramoyl-L-alanyl-D-glutamate--2,6-diaminopimelate ligase|nr:UDP-N-acetylmuramoyl-L-alanyl-D-glutamate--2,6-diaminopimelate ligase [Clostridiales bacterium]
MKLSELLSGVEVMEARGDMNTEVTGVAKDHRQITAGGLFVCVPGFRADGHVFIPGAAENGAAALIVERSLAELEIPGTVRAAVRVSDARRALAAVSAAFFGAPSKKFTLVGVTGTKGKTTTAYMIYSILLAAGRLPGLIGTVENLICGESQHASETTPESVDLQRLFSQMADRGTDSVVMEVSSQGLALSRVGFCDFDIGVFTNFYKDHISPNEHKDLADYLSAKLKLFSLCRAGVVNADIPEYEAVRAAAEKSARCESLYSFTTDAANTDADVRASQIEPLRGGGGDAKAGIAVRFFAETPWFKETVTVALPGRYNVSNALAAITVCGLLGLPKAAILEGLAGVCVRGRTQLIGTGQDFSVIVDYAHNAASLETLLLMLREYRFSKITTVFGCGGDRARDRRFEMGEVSGRLSSFTVITSDNPRSEAPSAIMGDIETGVRHTGGRYLMIEDRKEAIGYAIRHAEPGELVLIAGKGHETTQTFRDRTIHFDDAEVARGFLNAKEEE